MSKENFDPAMINLFKQEAGKHILKVNNLMLAMEKEGVKKEKFLEMKREVHTLKGDSRMLGFIKISDASHYLEELFLYLGTEEEQIDKILVENIFECLDAIQKAIDKLPDEEIDIDVNLYDDMERENSKKDEKIVLFDDVKEQKKSDKRKLFDNTENQKVKNQKDKTTADIKEK